MDITRAAKFLKSLVKRTAGSMGYRISRLAPQLEVQDYIEGLFGAVVARQMRESASFTFIQVGGYDGLTGDLIHEFIRRFGWRGVICEPAPESFRLLQRTYASCPGVRLELVAISGEDGTNTLYFVRRGYRELPDWVYQLSSFDVRRIQGIQFDGQPIDDLIESVSVPCLTLASLARKYQLEDIDLLQIDTEGHDLVIIKSIDFKLIKPKIIRFEHRCMSRNDKSEASAILLTQGYQIIFERFDVLAFLNQEWEDGCEDFGPETT